MPVLISGLPGLKEKTAGSDCATLGGTSVSRTVTFTSLVRPTRLAVNVAPLRVLKAMVLVVDGETIPRGFPSGTSIEEAGCAALNPPCTQMPPRLAPAPVGV